MFRTIPRFKRLFICIVIAILLIITFETAQQLYYINRYEIAEGVTFFELLKGQSYRWMVWTILGLFLFGYIKHTRQEANSRSYYIKLLLSILGLVVVNIFIISWLQMTFSKVDFSTSLFFNEFVVFYIFQKAPMYTLGYLAISAIFHLYFSNEQLQVKVHHLADVKNTNELLYKKLSTYTDDKAQVLTIKIGNKKRIVPVAQICWIESDDYCVKVHTNEGDSLSMRSSLKALEEKLGANFLRVHRKAIVNMDYVKAFTLSSTPKIILENQEEVQVSKSQLKGVRDFLGTLEIS